MEPKKFYFTFGSAAQFPFRNGYIVINAQNEATAVKEFRRHYPDSNENTVNCAFWYDETQWKNSDNQKYYKEPFRVINEGDFDKEFSHLVLEDFDDFAYNGSDVYNAGHSISHYFDCTINGIGAELVYEVTRHDGDEMSFSIHTTPRDRRFNVPDVWDAMEHSELDRFDTFLGNQVKLTLLYDKIKEAKTPDELKEIDFELMEREDLNPFIRKEAYTKLHEKEAELGIQERTE